MSESSLVALVKAASAPYRAADRFAYHFARGKLAADPAFNTILARGLLAGRGRILDLGCGQGLLAAWLHGARAIHRSPAWPTDWPAPPAPDSIRGIDSSSRDIERARRALGERTEFIDANICDADYGTADAIVLLDVLHYLEPGAQLRVLTRARHALAAGGVLVLRVGDAEGGIRFRYSRWVDRIVLLARGRGFGRLHCRPAREWRRMLESEGFLCEGVPMSGASFANVLLVAHVK